MRLYITSISATPIPHLEYKVNKWKKHISVFCLNEVGEVVLLVCPFRPFVLFQFEKKPVQNNDENDKGDMDAALDEINNIVFKSLYGNGEDCGYETLSLEPSSQTPLFGYSKSRKDKVWKLFYDQVNSRQKLVDHLNEHGFGSDEGAHLGKVTVYHQNTIKPNQEHLEQKYKQRKFGFSDEEHFKEVTGLESHTWIDVDLHYLEPKTKTRTYCHPCPQTISRFIHDIYQHVQPESIKLLDDILTCPPVSIVQLRAHAFSNDATNTNPFQASCSKPDDRLDMIGLLHYRLDQPIDIRVSDEKDCDRNPNFQLDNRITILENEDERKLLLELKDYIQYTNPQILVQSFCMQNDLEYIAQRAKKVFGEDYEDLGLSIFTDLPVKVRYFQKINQDDKNEPNKLQDIIHVGRERLDLVAVLQKFYVDPPLHGYSLLEAYQHEKLIRDKDKRNLQLDRMQLHHRPTKKDVEIRLKQELKVMYYLCVDNAFVESQMLLAKFCDASIQTICERGIELQTRNFIMKRLMRRNIYMNHDILDELIPFLVVLRKRCDSSFPHPPDIPNPTEREILGHKVTKKKPKFDMKRFWLKPGQSIDDEVQKPTKKSKKGYSGGLVVDSEPGFRCNPRLAAVILDFQSLYPSVIIGYLLCYMGVLMEKDKDIEHDPRATIRYIPLDDDTCAVFVTHYDGKPVETIIPEITDEIMQRRNKLKLAMKSATDPFIWETLNCRQLTAKIQANALYGFIGSLTSGMNLMAVAAAVCLIAQFMNRKCIYEAKKRGSRVTGGDTDSSFGLWNVSDVLPIDQEWTKEQIYAAIMKKGVEFGEHCSTLFPKPNKYVAEALKNPMLTTNVKKFHCSLAYAEPKCGWAKFDWSKAEPEVCVKGPAFKKRDRCNFVQKIGWKFIDMLLHQEPERDMLNMIEIAIQQLTSSKFNNVDDLKPFIITCKLGVEAEYVSTEILALHLKNQIFEESGITILEGRRMEYVVARFTDDRKRYLHAMTPQRFILEGHTLDTTHYAMTQLYPPLGQLTEMHLPLFARKIHYILEQYALKLDLQAEGQTQKLCFTRRQKVKKELDIVPEIKQPEIQSTKIQDEDIWNDLGTPLHESGLKTVSILSALADSVCNPIAPTRKRQRINLSDLGI
jgi:DNA polymerase elongation subunit (family B)